MTNYSELRASLVKIARDRKRPAGLRQHAEIMIAQIDTRERDPSIGVLPFAYARLQRARAAQKLPQLAPAEIVSALGLGGH
jgi:hypothetical protein